jgi:hypothetical protein
MGCRKICCWIQEDVFGMKRRKCGAVIVAALALLTVGGMPRLGFAQSSASDGWHPEAPNDPPGVPAPRGRGVLTPAAPVVRGEFTSIQVNTDGSGANIPGDAANEPSLAVDPSDPDRMAIGWRQFDTVASDFRQAGVAYSTDGGATWTFSGVIDPGQFRSDPVLASDANGRFYYSSLSAVDAVEVFISNDGGVTWPTETAAFGGDKQWFTVDATDGMGAGHLYQNWNVQFSCCAPNDFTRSTDGGASFESPLALPMPSMKWGTLAVGPDGTLYAAGSDLIQRFTKSTNARDAAQTPSFDPVQALFLGGITTIATGAFEMGPNPGGLLGQVWIAVDHSNDVTAGNLYVLGSVDPPGDDPGDVMLIHSEDDGASWSAPVRVNDDPADNGAWQWFGTLSVAPNGRIDAAWNDTRADATDATSELYYAYSIDGGASWSSNVPLSPAFDPKLGYAGSQNKIGDYYHMVSFDSQANLAYAATFNGEQDIFFVRIAPDCNDNGIHDGSDILAGDSLDSNGDGVPDECSAEVPTLPIAGLALLGLAFIGVAGWATTVSRSCAPQPAAPRRSHAREARLRAPGDHRNPLDENEGSDLRSRSSREAAATR